MLLVIDHLFALLVNAGILPELHLPRPNVSGGGELDAVLGAGYEHRVPKLRQVPADALKLVGGHADNGTVLRVLDMRVKGGGEYRIK